MRQVTLERPVPVALTLKRAVPHAIDLSRPAPVTVSLAKPSAVRITLSKQATQAITLQLVGDRPATAGTTVNLAGSAVASGMVSGQIDASLSLSGDAANASTATGTISASLDMAGASDSAATASGSVDASVSLSGASDGHGTASGAVDASVSLSGASSGTGEAAGTITAQEPGTVSLSGTTAGEGEATGSIDASLDISGGADGSGQASGTLSAAADLSGASSGSGSADGSVSASLYLSGESSGDSQADGTINAEVDLAGDSDGSGAASGTISAEAGLAGTSTGAGVASGAISASIDLSGSTSGAGSASGTVSAEAGLSGASTGGGSTSGAISATASLAGASSGSGAASGIISASSAYSLPTVVGTVPFVAGTGTISPTFAATGRSVGDLLILAIESGNQAITTPSGFTQATNSPQSTGTAAAAGGVRLGVFYKISDGTETTISVADTGDHTTASGIVVRGVDATTPIHVSVGQTQAATTSIVINGVTTTQDNCLIVQCLANDRDITGTNNLSSVTNAGLGSLTKQVDATNSAGAGGGVAIITGTKATAGATGNTTATNAASVTNASITLAIALGVSGLIKQVFFAPGVNPTNHTFSNSNKTVTAAASSVYTPVASGLILTGKVYVELTLTNVGSGESDLAFGISNSSAMADLTGNAGNANLYAPDDANGAYIIPSGARFRPGYTMANGDIWQLAYDQAAGTVMYGINDVWTTTYSVPTSGMFIVGQCGRTSGSSITVNGGSSAFAFTPPTGYSGPDT